MPKRDIIFKLLFADNRNKDILVDFLKSFLTLPEEEYDIIVITDPYLKRETLTDKLGIVDVKLTTKSGFMLHIEIQVLEQEELPERIVYYNSKILVTQLKSGEEYDTLKKTVSIAIADFDILADQVGYHHVFHLNELSTGIRFTDIVEINTIELSKIPIESDNTKKYEWGAFLKSEKKEEFEMLAKQNPVIKKAYDEVLRLSEDEETQMLYEAREKALKDFNSATKSAIKKREKEIAKNLHEIGLTNEQISKATKLSIEEIEKIIVK